MTDAPLLDLRVEGKSYDGKRVLDAVRLTIAPSEVVSIVGPSGCGKSTLLRIVAGLETHFRGTYLFEGQRQAGPSAKIGVVFQEPRLLPWLTVADNIAFSAGHGQGKDPRVAKLLMEVGLPDAGHLLPKQLSGGMAQRVAIARGLFSQPQLLLLDEPFSAVDEITRERLQDLLQALTLAHGTATLLVTHDLEEAIHLSDRVLVMTPSGTEGAGHIAESVIIPGVRPRPRVYGQAAHAPPAAVENRNPAAIQDLKAKLSRLIRSSIPA